MKKITMLIAALGILCSSTVNANQHIKQVSASMPIWVIGSLGSDINQTWIFHPGPQISAIKYGALNETDLELVQKQDYSFSSKHSITFSQFAETVPDVAKQVTDLLAQGYPQVILNVYPTKELFKETINDPDHCPPCTRQRVLLESIASKDLVLVHTELKM